MSDTLREIKSRGHWHVIIRPTAFEEKRVEDIARLAPIIEKSAVQLRGWDFPHFDRQNNLRVGDDWVDQSINWEHYVESWRFYQSGQFVSLLGMPIDWRDQSTIWPIGEIEKPWTPGRLLDVMHTIFRYTEIFEFAARVSLSEAGDDTMHITVRLEKLQDRELWIVPGKRTPFLHSYKCLVPIFAKSMVLSRAELSASAKTYALQSASELFKRFNWNPPMELLKSMQSEIGHL